MGKFTLATLPEDLLVRILVHGTLADAARLSVVCRSLAAATRSRSFARWAGSSAAGVSHQLAPWDTTGAEQDCWAQLAALHAVPRMWRDGAPCAFHNVLDAMGDVLWAVDANISPAADEKEHAHDAHDAKNDANGAESAVDDALDRQLDRHAGFVIAAGEDGYLRAARLRQRRLSTPTIAPDEEQVFEMRAHVATIMAVATCRLEPHAHTGERRAILDRHHPAAGGLVLVACGSADGSASLHTLDPGAETPRLVHVATLSGMQSSTVVHLHAAVWGESITVITCHRSGAVLHWVVAACPARMRQRHASAAARPAHMIPVHQEENGSTSGAGAQVRCRIVTPAGGTHVGRPWDSSCRRRGAPLSPPQNFTHHHRQAPPPPAPPQPPSLVCPVSGVGGVRFVDMVSGDTLATHEMPEAVGRLAEFVVLDPGAPVNLLVTTHPAAAPLAAGDHGDGDIDGDGVRHHHDGDLVELFAIRLPLPLLLMLLPTAGGAGGDGGGDDGQQQHDRTRDAAGPAAAGFAADAIFAGGDPLAGDDDRGRGGRGAVARLVGLLATDALREPVISLGVAAPFAFLGLDRAVLVVNMVTGETSRIDGLGIIVALTPLSASRFLAVTFDARVVVVSSTAAAPRPRAMF
jgi:hypothetical protein